MLCQVVFFITRTSAKSVSKRSRGLESLVGYVTDPERISPIAQQLLVRPQYASRYCLHRDYVVQIGEMQGF